MSFRVGDKVKIRKYLKEGLYCDYLYVNDEMAIHAGEIGTVVKVDDCSTYLLYIDDCTYWWNDEMLENPNQTIADKIRNMDDNS